MIEDRGKAEPGVMYNCRIKPTKKKNNFISRLRNQKQALIMAKNLPRKKEVDS
jgi:hypothetical protein